MTSPPPAAATAARRNPLIRFLSSIRTGIALLVLILAYASIGSGVAPVRGILEMTEMQVFEHWLFLALIVLFSICLITATLTRVRLNAVEAGTWIVHTGLIMLVAGCVAYFSLKVEGDVLLISPRIELLTVDGRPLEAALPVVPGEKWETFLPVMGGEVSVEVIQARAVGDNPAGEAIVKASAGDGAAQFLTLQANAETPTPFGGVLALRLRTYAPESRFYDRDAAALYYGKKGASKELAATELKGLPIHRERYLDYEGVLRDSAGQPVPSQRTWPHVKIGGRELGGLRIPGIAIATGWFEHWRMPIAVPAPDLPFDVAVTGYVPYIAGTESGVVGDNPEENPIVGLRLTAGGRSVEPVLIAFDPQRAKLNMGVPLEFRWVRSAAEQAAAVEALTDLHVLVLAGPDLEPTLAVWQAPGSVRQTQLLPRRPQSLPVSTTDVQIELISYERYGRVVSRPVIHPRELRPPGMGRLASAIRLQFTGRGANAGWSESQWVTYSDYPRLEPSPELASRRPRRITVRLPDGQEYEFIYSRVEHDLGASLVGGKLTTRTFPGGYAPESWRSDFHVLTGPAGAPMAAAVETNHTHEVGAWTLFQSGADGDDRWRWTVLGVGNRIGIWPMMIGSVLITIGCIYAFYVKPVLRKRTSALATGGLPGTGSRSKASPRGEFAAVEA